MSDIKIDTRALPEHGARRGHVVAFTLPRIPVRTLDPKDSGRILLPAQNKISYLFRGGALAAGVIRTSWVPPALLDPDRIYVRLVHGPVFQAIRRSLTEFEDQFGPPFHRIHQSLLINTDAIAEVNLGVSEIGMHAGTAIDYLRVARSHLSDFSF